MTWLLKRLGEPSSWRGLIWLATAAGVSLSPEAWEYVMAIGMAVAGLVGVLSREEPKHELPIDLVGKPESDLELARMYENALSPERRAEIRDRWRDGGFNG